ncbi:MAG: 16S rRNA (adenine(1518)-N(6)/adenine(1519)-N(6))-dimethyltransferase RsmA [Nitrospirota bacterium]
MRRLGQHFLFDRSIIKRILDTASLTKSDTVVEIGAGTGLMTGMISERVQKVIAIELDRRLCERLRRDLTTYRNVEIVEGDALYYPYESIKGSFKVVANLPYYITTPIIFRLLSAKAKINGMTLMIQKEVAERIVASPGNKDYGVLSVVIQFYTKPEIAFAVPRKLFRPPPEVDSSVLKISILDKPSIEVKDESYFIHIVRIAFSQRRKMLINSLKAVGIGIEVIRETLLSAGIDPTRRAETLSIEEFGRLSDALKDRTQSTIYD